MTIERMLWSLLAAAGIGLFPLATAAEAPATDFDALAALEGDWVAVGKDGAPTDQVVSRWKVTAGGSAVLETLFPGSAHEMVTVYHRDGDDLVLTHYCAMGNQPRMKITRVNPKRLAFQCQGGGNIPSEDVAHMHSGWIEWVDADHVRSEWTNLDQGQTTHKAEFDLVRRR